jgi:hypothetical protein
VRKGPWRRAGRASRAASPRPAGAARRNQGQELTGRAHLASASRMSVTSLVTAGLLQAGEARRASGSPG